MAPGYEVTPDALGRFATVIGAQADRLERVHQVLAGISVSQDAFGKLPISADLYNAYQEHSKAEVDNSAQAAKTFAGVANALRAIQQGYQEAEQASTIPGG